MTLAAGHVAGGAAGHSTAQRLEGRAGQAVAALDVACAVLIVQRLDSTLFSCHQDGMGFSFFFLRKNGMGFSLDMLYCILLAKHVFVYRIFTRTYI